MTSTDEWYGLRNPTSWSAFDYDYSDEEIHMAGRVPNREAAVLGTFVANPGAMGIHKGLEAHHFEPGPYQDVFKHLEAGGERVRPEAEKLRELCLRHDGGRTAFLEILAHFDEPLTFLRANVSTLLARHAAKSIGQAGNEIGATARGFKVDADDPYALQEQAQSTLDAAKAARPEFTPIGILEALDALDEDATEYGAVRRGVAKTGIASIDNRLECLNPGELLVVAARSGIGKTHLAVQASCITADRGGSVLFMSLEMSRKEVAARIVSYFARVDSKSILRNDMGEDERKRVSLARQALRRQRWSIQDQPGPTPAEIMTVARQEAASKGDLSLLVVDYAGLMRLPGKETKAQELGQAVQELKNLARELECAVLLVAQINRQGADGVPGLHHLKDSGDIEQAADHVVMLYRIAGGSGGPFKSADTTEGPMHALLAKSRRAPSGLDVQLIPDLACSRLVEFESEAKDMGF